MADDVCFALLRNTIYQILHSAGFESSHGEPANVLADIFGQYIQLLASSATTYAQLAGRTVASPWDIADGLVDVQVTMDQLQDWLDSEQGQFLAPSWSTKADPDSVLKDVVTKGQVHHEVSQILYQYSTTDQHYYRTIDDKLEITNGDDVTGTTVATTTTPSPSSIHQDHGQHTASLPDYVPLHLPFFPSPDSNSIVNQPNDTPHQSNQKRDDTTMQSEYSTTTMLSSLLPSTDHKLSSTTSTSPPILSSSSKKTNDNPFTHVVAFDDSSLVSGSSLSLALSSVNSKPSSSLQQQPQQLDLEEKMELELSKKQRKAEINGIMEATINTVMEQYRQQQTQLEMDGNQAMFQCITQKEAAPGKTSLGTRDSILDEMVYRLAPPMALARLSSPNLLLDTAITQTPPSPNTTGNKDTPIDLMENGNRPTQSPSSSTLEDTAPPLPPPLAKTAASSSQATMDLLKQSTPIIPSKAVLTASSSSTVDPSHIAASSTTSTYHPPSSSTVSFGLPPIPTSSQPAVKTPMSIAMLSARDSTNSIKKDKNGLSVKTITNEAKNGNTVLPKKKKKHRLPMDMDNNNNVKRTPPIPPSSSEQLMVSSSTNSSLAPTTTTTTNTESVTTATILKKRRRKKDDNNKNNDLGRQGNAPDIPPPKVRFKEQVDISNSSYEHHYWSTPSPSLHHHHHPAQATLSNNPTIPTSTHSPMTFTSATAVSSPVPLSTSAAAAVAVTTTATTPPTTSSSSHTPTSGHVKKKKKKKKHGDDQQAQSFDYSTATVNKNLSATKPAPTKMTSIGTGGTVATSSFYQPKKPVAPLPTLPLHSSSAAATVARTTPTVAAPIMLLPTPATNMYCDTVETVQCICENPTVDYGTFMISCDRCLVWFHGSCVGIAEHNQVDYWICTRCQ